MQLNPASEPPCCCLALALHISSPLVLFLITAHNGFLHFHYSFVCCAERGGSKRTAFSSEAARSPACLAHASTHPSARSLAFFFLQPLVCLHTHPHTPTRTHTSGCLRLLFPVLFICMKPHAKQRHAHLSPGLRSAPSA